MYRDTSFSSVQFLSVLAAALLITSISTPLWIWLVTDDDHVGIGLFYRTGLNEEELRAANYTFRNIKVLSEQTLNCRHWSAMAAMQVFATVFAVFQPPMLYVYQEHVQENKKLNSRYKNLMISFLSSLIFNFMGLILFILYHGDAATEGPDISDESFPWAPLMSLLAAACHLISAYVFYTRNGRMPFLDFLSSKTVDARTPMINPRLNGGLGRRSFRSMPAFINRAGLDDDFFNSHLMKQQLDIVSAGDINDRRDWANSRPREYVLRRSSSEGRLATEDRLRRQSDFQLGLVGLHRGEITNSAYRKLGESAVNPAWLSEEPRINESYTVLDRRTRDDTMNDNEEYVYNRVIKPAVGPKTQLARAMSQSRSHVY